MRKTFVLFALMLFAGIGYAADPVAVVPGMPESRYGFTNGSVAISSFTISTFTVTTGYREITLTAPTSFFYTVNGSTSNISTIGYPGLANIDVVIESNQLIYVQSPPGIAASTGRYIQKRK